MHPHFGTYEAASNFDATISFTTLTFFNTLRLPLVKVPKGLRDVLDARLALDCIEPFLLESELEDAPNASETAKISENIVFKKESGAVQVTDLISTGRDHLDRSGVHIAKSEFSYCIDAETLLHDITHSLPGGSLLVVA